MNNLKSWSHQVKQMVSPIDKGTLNFGSFKLYCDSVWDAVAKNHLEAWSREVRGVDRQPSGSGGKLSV